VTIGDPYFIFLIKISSGSFSLHENQPMANLANVLQLPIFLVLNNETLPHNAATSLIYFYFFLVFPSEKGIQ
jgi:hypothetical protein